MNEKFLNDCLLVAFEIVVYIVMLLGLLACVNAPLAHVS